MFFVCRAYRNWELTFPSGRQRQCPVCDRCRGSSGLSVFVCSLPRSGKNAAYWARNRRKKRKENNCNTNEDNCAGNSKSKAVQEPSPSGRLFFFCAGRNWVLPVPEYGAAGFPATIRRLEPCAGSHLPDTRCTPVSGDGCVNASDRGTHISRFYP